MSAIAEIQRATAAHFGLTREELLGPGRSRCYAWPRQVGMAIAREHGHSLPKIGRKFGRHHTTVLRAARAISERGNETVGDVTAIKADLERYTGVLVDIEKKAEAARSIGAFCVALGCFVARGACASA